MSGTASRRWKCPRDIERLENFDRMEVAPRKGEGENPETIEKQPPGDYAIFDRRIDGAYRERFGDRVIDEEKQ